MAIPQPRYLTRPENASLDAGAREDPRVALGQFEPLAKDSSGHRWRIRNLAMFHVKHPPGPPPGRSWELHGCNSGRSVKKNDDPARRLGTLALAVHTVDGGHGVVHDLALERSHRVELFTLPALQHPVCHAVPQRGQLIPATTAPLGDVQHQPAPLTGLLVHREAGQLLECVEHLALASDELVQIIAAVDADDRAVPFD